MTNRLVRRLFLLFSAAALSASLDGCSTSDDNSTGTGDGNSVFMNAVPPGANGNSAGGKGLPIPGIPVKQYPPNFVDQLKLYGDLSYAQQNLQTGPCRPPADLSGHVAASNLACNYFKHEGLTPDEVVSTETLKAPSGGTVTIRRDGWGVPFINAANRADAMYGFGWASGEDRLWLYDVVRHLGRGRLSEYLGPAAAFYSYDSSLAVEAGYSEDELTEMVNTTAAKYGTLGAQVVADLDNDVAGINGYLATLQDGGINQDKRPPEYATLKRGGFPTEPFTRNDIVASAILIQSIFATGGGAEQINELLLQELDPGFGAGSAAIPSAACKLWRDLRQADDPDAHRTIDASFHQSPATLDESCPHLLASGAAIWDVGSFENFTAFTANNAAVVPAARQPAPKLLEHLLPDSLQSVIAANVATADVSVPLRHHLTGLVARSSFDPLRALRNSLRATGFGLPDTMSNFIGVTADQTADGHPIAVMGPQTSYFVPQMLWEVAIHSDGGTPLDFNGRGIVFANLPYINIGRGTNYAWSATSGESDLTDVRVSKMCNMNDTPASRDDNNGDGFPDADGYLFDLGDGNGPQCRRFYERTDTWLAQPTLASIGSGGPAQAQQVTRYILRTHYGPVFATATVNGEPVAISIQRSTFLAELDTAAPFALASTHVVKGAESFQQLFNGVTGSFNWLYVDAKDIGYLHSGLYPVRDANQDADLPVWGDGHFDWASTQNLPTDFFTSYGGSTPFPGLVTAAIQGDPLQGHVEWPNFLQLAQHPQTINPSRGYITSWNNNPATGWWAADNNGSFGPTHRVDMLAKRLAAFQDSGRKFDFGNMVEIMADAGYTDLRGQEVLPLLLQIMNGGSLDATQQQVVTLMQSWMDNGSSQWISGQNGLGSWRRDRDGDGVYDERQAVLLMDAWYPHLITALLPQVTAIDHGDGVSPGLGQCSGYALQCPYDAPRAQGSAYQAGYFQFMKRVLQMTLNTPGHTDYRALKCAGTGVLADCRSAVLSSLDQALSDLGGFANRTKWDGKTLVSQQYAKTGKTVETYDAIQHQAFSMLPVPAMPWVNRPTFQQVVEVRN
jgi:acyl-homoserine lactone acylase PvdQ